MERRPQQTSEDDPAPHERERHLRVVGAAALNAPPFAPLQLPDLSVDADMERRLDWPTHRVGIQMWLHGESQSHPRLLFRIAEQLRGRHSASWFIPPNGVRIHFSVGDWEDIPDEDLEQFAAEVGDLLGADPTYTKLRRHAIDIPAALAAARDLGIDTREFYVAHEATATNVTDGVDELTSR